MTLDKAFFAYGKVLKYLKEIVGEVLYQNFKERYEKGGGFR